MVDKLHAPVICWYQDHARDLPWRGDATPWAIMVSEFMLQQTPVARVLPVFNDWMSRWPTPSDLAGVTAGEAIRAWGRLGYPRRALRLHAAAIDITRKHDGQVPDNIEELRCLPGVGEYTAAAIASFAFHQAHVVLDINVRRLFERAVGGRANPSAAVSVAERERAAGLMPDDAQAPTWAAATMELGALVCTSRNPACHACPISTYCAWRLGGYPNDETVPVRRQRWHGTDRQCRGRIMAVLRDAPGPVAKSKLDLAWPDATQFERCLDSLLDDGLVEPADGDRFSLPR